MFKSDHRHDELVTELIWFLHHIITSNNNSLWAYTVYNPLWHPLGLLSLLCLCHSSGNGNHQRTFPLLRLPELSPCLIHSNCLLTTAQLPSQKGSLQTGTLHVTHVGCPFTTELCPIKLSTYNFLAQSA
jgi:hypothetical protein